jgi:hypothetical protein
VTAVCSTALLHSPSWQLSFLASVFLRPPGSPLPLFALSSLSYSIQPVVSFLLSLWNDDHSHHSFHNSALNISRHSSWTARPLKRESIGCHEKRQLTTNQRSVTSRKSEDVVDSC